MLAQLRVRELVLIEELDLELAPGFNALTGETGAGKSLVIAAFDLLMGGRASPELVRRGAVEAEVEGLFDISDEPRVRERLEEAGLPSGDELLVRRVVPADGRNRCWINGKLASLSVLGELASGLASVMGQHEHHTLFDPAVQLALLDEYGVPGKLRAAMAEAHARLVAARGALDRLERAARDRGARLDFVRFQIDEIDRIAPAAGELEKIEREAGLLRHQELLLETARRGVQELYEADGSVFERLGGLAKSLEEVSRHDESLAPDARQLADAVVLVEEAARSLAAYGRGFDPDPARLEALEERREALKRLSRKHGVDLAGVLALREGLAAELRSLERYEDSLREATDEVEAARSRAAAAAAALTAKRRAAATRFSAAATKELEDLAFAKAAMEARLGAAAGDPGPDGADALELYVDLNPGEGAHPLRKVASGGELSRVMLAVRRVLAGLGPVGTYVFDEVDAGVGGAVATSVGRKLRDVAAHHQVICVTHLPQIAAMCDAHFRVSKEEGGGRTVTRVGRLGAEERVEEIAQMLGGERVTAKIRAAARELIGRGR
ncbi:MAG: DNA repair protein RecN [Proteobacteria bacterium]|jgi:DNA repair protein RecN (Recombination protein N)|nr:DNA repair protein RecN [Pseudomonadota bacterium]